MVNSSQRNRKERKVVRDTDIAKLESKDRLKLIAEYGVLAPSTHNTQPWKLQLDDSAITIFADYSKIVPQADPYTRDLYISIGTLIKNIQLAADAFGVGTEVDFAHDINEQQPRVARIAFLGLDRASMPTDGTMLDALVYRQNYRGAFLPAAPQEFGSIVESLQPNSAVSIDFFSDEPTREQIALLTAEGLRIAYRSPDFRQEISTYINHNFSPKRYGLHGYSLRMSTPLSFIVPKIMKRKDIGAKLAALNHKSFITAPIVAVLWSNDGPRDWIEVGLVLEELMVNLKAAGVASSIYAAAIEMQGLRKRLQQILSGQGSGRVPQLVLCVGYPAQTMALSARKRLEDVMHA